MSAPAWLEELQARFGATIRTPLDRASGTLTATPDAYDADVVARATRPERLAVYNRQYWFRLLEVMQGSFPLTARLLGFWDFNDYAARFLLARPPRGWDVDEAPDGFDAFLDDALAEDAPDRVARVEAARIDAAFRGVFRAPDVVPFRPTQEDAATLLDAQLELSPAVAIVSEHTSLVELRRVVLEQQGEARVDAPSIEQFRSWAIVRRGEATLTMPLEPREAELFALLAREPIRHALARLEATCSDDERSTLPARTRAWLARSVQLGFWISRR